MKVARITMAAVGVAAMAGLGPVPFAHAATGAVSCLYQGSGSTSPGVVMQPTDQVYQFTGTFTCDPTSEVSSGTVTATGTGNFGCTSGASGADLTVTWNDNSTTKLHVDFTHIGVELLGASGSVTEGRFAGRGVFGDMLFYITPTADNPAKPLLEGGKCGSSGLQNADLLGVYSILP